MGVKCSLLGHDYGDTDVERERTEQGDEVVRTAKRVERCRNCDHTRTVSENTEVTALEAAAGVVREPDGTILAATDRINETPSASLDSSIEGGGSSSERSASDGGLIIENLNESDAISGLSDENDTDPANESGDTGGIDEIRTDRPKIRTKGPNRAPGEWPAEPDEPTRAPKTRDESAGLDSSGSLTVAQTDTNPWPDETDATAKTQTELPMRRSTAGNGPGDSDASARTGRPDTVFACPSCGFSASIADSPLRAGDICPGCHHGYLAQETRKG